MQDFFFEAYIVFLFFVLGLVFGSFCNAWAWRIVHDENIARGRSHCAVCGHELAAKDLVPLFSWLFLKGKCRYCGAPISKRYPLAELILGAYFLSVYLVYGLTFDCLRLIILGCLLLVCSLVDYDTMELPDPLMAAAALAALLRLTEPGGWKSALIGCFAVSVPLLIVVLIADRILKKESMGGGDIKLLAVLGLHFGPAKTFFLLIIACIIGILAASAAKKGKGTAFPFGPVLALSAWITALIGTPVVNWYLSLF
ncbi:MAG: prepilin peptidase [Eubacteriales bacterium]|nr:prepilin peptidase [Eubacteriales bacterium]